MVQPGVAWEGTRAAEGGWSLRGAIEGCVCFLSKQDRLNSKKHKAKDEKKLVKSFSRDRFSLEDAIPESTTPFQEPTDPLVMEKYTQRLHIQVRAEPGHSALLLLIPTLHSLIHPVCSTKDDQLLLHS